MSNSLRDSLQKSFSERVEPFLKSRTLFSEADGVEKKASRPPRDLIPFGSIQQLIRPTFAKEGVREPTIGDHPDFAHLRGTDNMAFAPTVTFFMDIANSTRLGLLYDLQDVKLIKNAFIQLAIEVVHAFDGHVHRIMGDAVMAFFGGLRPPDQCAVDALNCAAIIQYLAKEVVNPWLDTRGYRPIGIRVGLDYGKANDVLWSSYGYPGSEEVTATSFYVDIASKIQHDAGMNQIMVGQNLVEFLDFPQELLAVKNHQRAGERVEDPYVTAYLLPDATKLNYRKWLFQWESYLGLMPSSISGLAIPGYGGPPITVSAQISSEKHGILEGSAPSCAVAVPKKKWLRFTIGTVGLQKLLPLTIRCVVENHGTEAEQAQSLSHEKEYQITTERAMQEFVHWESTSYRGLHYLDIVLRFQRGATLKGRHAIFIQ